MTNETLPIVEDSREEMEPSCFSFRDLPADGDVRPFMEEMHEVWSGQCEWARFTIVSEEFPKPPYPPGLYFEGWPKAPHSFYPPRKEAPFNFPLTATGADR
jgi:hypothetical protein